jgi:hypothetical protein
MKKILLCLIAGVLSFYIGIFTQSLFYWENVKLEILPIEEQGIIIFDISKSACYPGLSSNGPKYLYLPFTGVGYGYYYNLPSSNGRHAPDFSLDGVLYVRPISSLTDQQPFELESLTFNEQDFSFITKQIGNIKYSMEGKMPTGKNGNVIEGTLTKYRDGKIVFKRKVVFREAVPSC